MITVTEKAAQRLQRKIESSPLKNPDAGIRFSVKAGGCSGFTYIPLTVAAKPNPHDNIFESNGIRIFVDPKSHVVVKDTEIDYAIVNLIGEFTFNNPNAKTSCGCGVSFDLK